MKTPLKAFLLYVNLAFCNFANATVQKACVCEIGRYPEYQQPAFSTGCNLWLREQKDCVSKQKVVHGTSYSQLGLQKDINQISIGYVGHWNDSRQLITYLHMRINPLMSDRNISVSIDNTACSSMNEPSLVLNYVKNMGLRREQTLTIKGNQTRSIGKWDSLIGPKSNFYAFVSNIKRSVTYPNCQEFQNYPCIQGVQGNDEALCITNTSQLKKLRCCFVQDNPYDDEIKMNYAWLPLNECY